MTGQSIYLTQPFSYAGALTRPNHSTVEPVVMDTTNPFAGDGLPGKKVNGKFVPLAAGDTAAVLYGIRVRSFPFTSDKDLARQLTNPTNYTGDALVRGYIGVKVNAGTVADNGAVYIRVGGATATQPIGGFEAVADATATNTVLVTNAHFIGTTDANGIAELAFNI
ncbi:hypothetical protein SAMN05216516_108135 [Izhakiella capsodis]|uniref:Uncharacterized protein n=1 Tax=Izhakiella capsodis TaxID=1367852 RepID=A0A1I4ZFC9_9GAMM|nr:hypothetical protein [Izhakiella capsodis]SFN48590.1 hypothetical protein SAMN05216516_108135 [Izhakiella capsodis]